MSYVRFFLMILTATAVTVISFASIERPPLAA